MARYNIELRSESHVQETLVVESNDLTELRIELAMFVGELLKDHAKQIWVDEDWRVDATDENGLILFTLHLFANDSAATMPLPRRRP